MHVGRYSKTKCLVFNKPIIFNDGFDCVAVLTEPKGAPFKFCEIFLELSAIFKYKYLWDNFFICVGGKLVLKTAYYSATKISEKCF